MDNRLPLLLTACIAAAATSAYSANPNLISNGSFEVVTPSTTLGGICTSVAGGPYKTCNATGWSGTYQIGNGPASGVPNGVNASFDIPQPDPDGVNALILQGTGVSATESFSVGAGGTYDLTFYLANRATAGLSGPQTVDVLFDDTVLPGGTYTGLSSAWTFKSLLLTTGAGTHTLTFKGLGNGSLDVAAFVDNVVFAGAVPEPGRILMFSVGLATLAAFAGFRRR